MNRKVMSVAIFLCIILCYVFSIGFAGSADKIIQYDIGVILPLSGPSASHGEDIIGGIKMAMQEINAKGGINGFKIGLVVEDDQSTPKDSVAALRKLIDIQKLPVIIGPVASGNMLAMVPIAESQKTVLISPAASSPKISDAGDYIFRNSLLAEPQGREIARFCINRLKKNRVALLFIDDETGRGYKDAFNKEIQSLGGKVIIEESFDKQSADFRSQLTKIMQLHPDAIYVPAIPKAMGLILRQSKELGMKAVFLANYGIEGEDLIKTAGEIADGIYYTSMPINMKFASNFEHKYGRKPTIGAPLGYDTLYIVAQAIKSHGYTSQGIKTGLYAINKFSGATGLITMNEKGDAEKEIIIKTVRNGRFVNVEKK